MGLKCSMSRLSVAEHALNPSSQEVSVDLGQHDHTGLHKIVSNLNKNLGDKKNIC